MKIIEICTSDSVVNCFGMIEKIETADVKSQKKALAVPFHGIISLNVKNILKFLGENSMIKYGHIKVDLAWLL